MARPDGGPCCPLAAVRERPHRAAVLPLDALSVGLQNAAVSSSSEGQPDSLDVAAPASAQGELPPAASGVSPAAGTAGSEPPQQGAAQSGVSQASTTSAKVDPLIGTVAAGRYRVEKLLGSGGMGAVYRAAHVHMRKLVALKVLHKEMTYLPEVVARFEREAVAAARIDHPHVAAATDFGRLDDGAFYLVLEYVEGKSLGRLISDYGAMDPRRALHIARQIADALSAAHAAEIVHRDLKPDNVMLIEKDGDFDFVKVLDFGIAKVQLEGKDQLTQLGTIFGTPQYMAPEQAAGQAVDARADLYTLGLILYEMLAGKSPFHDDDIIVLLTRQMTAAPPPLPAHVSPAVVELVLQLLQKNPGLRVQSAAELVRRIDACLSESMAPAPLPPSSAADGEEIGFGDTVLSMPRPEREPAAASVRTEPMSSAFRTWASRLASRVVTHAGPLASRRIQLGSRSAPAWWLVAGGAAVLVVITILIASSSSPDAASNKPPSESLAGAIGEKIGLGPNLTELMERAKEGDRSALSELLSRPPATRGAGEWLAIGHGQAKVYLYSQSLEAYAQAVQKQPELAADVQLLKNVVRAAFVPQTTEAALKFAAGPLGTAGADVLYAVASNGDKERATVARRADELLASPEVARKASPALDVILSLRRAKGCIAHKKLLPQVQAQGDQRAAERLKKILAVRKGCGFLGLNDCYSCMRRSDELTRALSAADARPAPSID